MKKKAKKMVENKTYICVNCKKKFTLNIKWMIDEIEKLHHAKICTSCQNKMWRKAVYNSDKSGCLNCD